MKKILVIEAEPEMRRNITTLLSYAITARPFMICTGFGSQAETSAKQ